MRHRVVAVLRDVCRRARPPGAAVVSPLRPTDPDGRRSMPGLSSGTDRIGPVGVRVPRTGSRSGSPPEVLRVARRGRGARSGGGRARPAACRCGDLGAARAPAAGRARVRPGSRARAGARARARPPRDRLRPSDEGDRSTGPTDAGSTTRGDEGCVRMHLTEAGAGSRPPGGRRTHDGRDGLRLRRSASRGRSTRDPSPHGLSLVQRSSSRTSRFAPSMRRAYTRACSRPGLWLPGDQPR